MDGWMDGRFVSVFLRLAIPYRGVRFALLTVGVALRCTTRRTRASHYYSNSIMIVQRMKVLALGACSMYLTSSSMSFDGAPPYS